MCRLVYSLGKDSGRQQAILVVTFWGTQELHEHHYSKKERLHNIVRPDIRK